jgi:ferritin-like metal-binding protein YciE
MTSSQDKIAQYLHEAHAMELSLVRTLQAHRAMTPTGDYRTAIERHLRETRGHADRVARRLRELGRSPSLAEMGYGLAQRLVGQVLALGKAPLDLVRGGSAEEKLLKNAKDECATEALEIATYDAIEQLARQAGDEITAKLAADHRADEERMLATLREQLPKLTAAVVGAEVLGEPSYDVGKTGAVQDIRKGQRAAGRAAEHAVGAAADVADIAGQAAQGAVQTARGAGEATGEAAEGAVAMARNAGEAAGEAAQDVVHGAREATGTLTPTEEREEQRSPLPNYDELTVDDVTKRINRLSPAQLRHVATYERAHKRRRGVLEAVERRQQEREREHAGR